MKTHAPNLHAAAQAIRADHGKADPNWSTWDRLAVWLECTAAEFEQGRPVPAPSVPISLAANYLSTRVPHVEVLLP